MEAYSEDAICPRSGRGTGVPDQDAAVVEHNCVDGFVLDVLKREVGRQKAKRSARDGHDLDRLFGILGDQEYAGIQEKIGGECQINEELRK